jgi:SAM-dependent methyltransferase
MRRTAMVARPGIFAGRSWQSRVWHLLADSRERSSMRAAGPASSLFSSPLWDSRFWGIDVAETAVAIAREKAADRRIEVEFVAADAFQLERLGRRFETVLDCELFHTFDAEERPRYVASLASVTERDGTLYVLCFSDDGPETGPHPIRQDELRAAFNPSSGWTVAAIKPDRIETRFHDNGVPAWLATIKRI